MSNHRAKKRFGQNFLIHQPTIARIVATISVDEPFRVVEIGPGQGALSELLLNKYSQLTMIELDRDLIPILQQKFSQYQDEAQIIHQDALKLNYADLAENRQLLLMGNLPYNISTPLLFHLLQYRYCIKEMLFMLQKEVVDRITASHGGKQYGRLSIMMQYYCQTEKCFEVPPTAFQPRPKVDSAIVRLIPRKLDENADKLHVALQKLTTQAFAQRRKTLRNNFKGLLHDQQLLSLGIEPSQRAEELSVQQFIELAHLVNGLQTDEQI